MDTSQILLTKLISPQFKKEYLYRPKLIDRINQDYSLILITAPAGFGKSSVVKEFIGSQSALSVWFSIDKSDNSLNQFLVYFIVAIQEIIPDFGVLVLKSLQSTQLPSIESLLTTLINEIVFYHKKFIFVFDDIHHINCNEIKLAMNFLILNQPRNMQIVITSRKSVNLKLGKLRTRGNLLEIQAEDLRLSRSGIELFLEKNMDQKISEKLVDTLENITEGWFTGLQLATISISKSSDETKFINSFGSKNIYVYEYLLEEVINDVPIYIQNILLILSICDRFCASLCDHLIGPVRLESEIGVLDELVQMNLFVTPLDKENKWYRFQNFFRDFLLQKLKKSGVDLNELHKKAGEWFEKEELVSESFQHYSASNDYDSVTKLISENINLSYSSSYSHMVISWLEKIPESKLANRPILLLLYISYLLSCGKIKGVKEKLRLVERTSIGIFDNILKGQLAIAKATLALSTYDLDTVALQSELALNYLPDDNGATTTALWMLGMYNFYLKEFIKADFYFDKSLKMSKLYSNRLITILSLISKGQILEFNNKLFSSEEKYKEAIELSGSPEMPISSESHIGIARINYEKNNLESSSKHALLASQLASNYDNDIDRFIFCDLFLAKLKRVYGDYDQAKAILHELKIITDNTSFINRKADIACEKVRLYIDLGQLMEAMYLAEKYSLTIQIARINLIIGKPDESLKLLESLLKNGYDSILAKELMEIKILQLLSYSELNNKRKAYQLFEEIIVPASEDGLIRIFLDEKKIMEDFLIEASKRYHDLNYIGIILESFKNEKMKNRNLTSSKKAKFQRILDPLSPRELEVLQLIAEGNTNQEICEALFIALDTVKGHNRKIFQKLNVDNRIQAINVSRDLKIITR